MTAAAKRTVGGLVITAEEEEEIREKIITQTATFKQGVDYPLKRLVKSYFVFSNAIASGDEEQIAETQESFFTELDTYSFDMSRYDVVVHALRTQLQDYEDEEKELALKSAELRAETSVLQTKLRASTRESAMRASTEELAHQCAEHPTRAQSASRIEAAKSAIDELRVECESLDAQVESRKKKLALLLEVVDSLR
jgi:THO complex subunit 7